jgi:hypothetical protein
MKKYLAIFAVMCAFADAPVLAQGAQPALDPATVAAAREMMSAMKIRELMLAGMQQMEQGMPAQLRQTIAAAINVDPSLSAEQKKRALARVERSMPKLMAVIHTSISDPTLLDEMLAELLPVYARHYTTAEIQQLATFYQSPLGQKMLANMPAVMAESMEISNRLMAPRIQKLMTDTMQSLED